VLLTKQIHLFSCLTARRQQQKERRVELKKASLRAAAAHAEVSPCEHRHGSCCSQCLCLSEMEEISRGKWCPVSPRALFLSSAPQSTALWRRCRSCRGTERRSVRRQRCSAWRRRAALRVPPNSVNKSQSQLEIDKEHTARFVQRHSVSCCTTSSLFVSRRSLRTPTAPSANAAVYGCSAGSSPLHCPQADCLQSACKELRVTKPGHENNAIGIAEFPRAALSVFCFYDECIMSKENTKRTVFSPKMTDCWSRAASLQLRTTKLPSQHCSAYRQRSGSPDVALRRRPSVVQPSPVPASLSLFGLGWNCVLWSA